MLQDGERFVVLDLLEQASLRLGGQSLYCVCPGFERRGVEGIREEGVIFCCRRHQLWRKGARIGAVPSPYGKGKLTGGSSQARVWVVCMLNSTTHFIRHAGCVNVECRQANGLPHPSWHDGHNHVFDQPDVYHRNVSMWQREITERNS